MSMNNEELSVKFAVMESQLTMLLASNVRIEAAMDRISSLDKMITQITSDNKYLNQKVLEIEKDTALCAASHKSEDEKLSSEVSILKDAVSNARGMARTAIWFIAGVSVVAGSFFTYLFNTASLNKETNVKQSQEILELKNWRGSK
jgi:hypothetical protein